MAYALHRIIEIDKKSINVSKLNCFDDPTTQWLFGEKMMETLKKVITNRSILK